jgi:hypothetical protein
VQPNKNWMSAAEGRRRCHESNQAGSLAPNVPRKWIEFYMPLFRLCESLWLVKSSKLKQTASFQGQLCKARKHAKSKEYTGSSKAHLGWLPSSNSFGPKITHLPPPKCPNVISSSLFFPLRSTSLARSWVRQQCRLQASRPPPPPAWWNSGRLQRQAAGV